MIDQRRQRLSDVHIASHNLHPLVLSRRVASCRKVVKEVGKDDMHSKRRYVDLSI